jgi:hypothetical protein
MLKSLSIFALLLACSGLPLPLWSDAVAQEIVIDGLDPFPPKPGGGKYRGPQDIVPTDLRYFEPYLECPNPPVGFCDGCALPQTCGVACDQLRFERWTSAPCVGCSGDGAGCFVARGFNLSFGSLRNYCHSVSTCPETNGVITVCVEVPNVCEVHVLQSAWLSHAYFPNKPLCMPVPTQVCVNDVGLFHPPVAFSSFTHRGLGCQPGRVCLSLQRDCLCSGVHNWEYGLGLLPWLPSAWDSKWLFHVGFTTCKACDGCR